MDQMCQCCTAYPYYYVDKYRCEAEEGNPDPVHAHPFEGQTQVMTEHSSPRCFTALHGPTFSTVNKPRKSVTFKRTTTVRTYSWRHGQGVTKEEKSRLYYSKEELNIFKLEAKAICTLSQELPMRSNSGTLFDEEPGGLMIGMDARDGSVDSLRGLELTFYPKRMQNKLLAQKTLLKYQVFLNSKLGMTEERRRLALAMASTKLNMWSSLVAAETARLDSLRAHDGDYLIPTEYAKPVTMIPPFSFYKQKRRGSRSVTPDAAGGAIPKSKRRKVDH